MYIAKFIKETSTEDIKCMTVAISKLQITFALAKNMWKTKGKERLIPIWVSKKGLFIFKLAIGVKFTA